MPECIFCKIVKKEIPSKIRYEDNDILAFDDINPKAKYHILLIPKEHIQSVSMLPDSKFKIISKLVLAAKRISNDLKIDQSGYRLIFNSGSDAGAEVDHVHLHLLGGEKLGPLN